MKIFQWMVCSDASCLELKDQAESAPRPTPPLRAPHYQNLPVLVHKTEENGPAVIFRKCSTLYEMQVICSGGRGW